MTHVIAWKEFRSYFSSPIAYVVLLTFVALANWFFFRLFFITRQADMRMLFTIMPWFLLFLVPAIAMGKWAEERKLGTMELLLTLPVSDRAVVMGKFWGSLALIAVALMLTLPLPLTVSLLGQMDWGPVVGGYIGLLLMAAAYLAIGLFVSSLTQNQIVAFIVSIVACFTLYILSEPIVTAALPTGVAMIAEYVGASAHFESIGRGVIDSRDLIYYISVIGFFLWCNWRVVHTRR
jgi:ABC-2 type transport system permease protein